MPSTLRPILGTSNAPKDELYSEQDMQAALLSYAAGNDLQHSNDSLKLDKLMVSNLFNKKEPQMEGDACPLDDVMKRLLGRHTTCACSLIIHPGICMTLSNRFMCLECFHGGHSSVSDLLFCPLAGKLQLFHKVTRVTEQVRLCFLPTCLHINNML